VVKVSVYLEIPLDPPFGKGELFGSIINLILPSVIIALRKVELFLFICDISLNGNKNVREKR